MKIPEGGPQDPLRSESVSAYSKSDQANKIKQTECI